jgi:hypothetical protein
VGNREFVDQFYLQIAGRLLTEAEGSLLGWWLDSGSGQRHEFMAHAAQQMTDNVFFRALPQGTMFDVVW